MEADLQQYHGLDYRDRWNPDRSKRLTLRRLVVLIWRNPPIDGAVLRATTGRMQWSLSDHLLDDLRRTLEMVNGAKNPKPHPLRDTSTAKRMTPERAKRLATAKRRARARRAALQSGEIT